MAAIMLAAAAAQQPPAPAAPASEAQQFCTREFGEQFKLDPKFAPLTTDLDGDGTDRFQLAGAGGQGGFGQFLGADVSHSAPDR